MTRKLLTLAMLFVAFAMGAQAQDDNVVTVLEENFDAFTEGSESAPATTDISSYSSGKLSKTLSGWSGSKVYEAGGSLKIDTYGNLQTTYLSKAVRGQVSKITLRVKPLASYGTAIQLTIGYGSTQDPIAIDGDAWTDIVVYTSAITLSSKLKIAPYMMFDGFLIDYIKIETSPSYAVIPVPELPSQADGVSFTAKWIHDTTNSDYLLDVYSKATNGDKEYVLHDEVVKPTSSYAKSVEKKVTGLDPAKTYYYTVRARNKGGYTSDYSEEIQVRKVIDDIDAPEASAATNITANGFTANWSAVADAVRYAVTLTCTQTLKDATKVDVLSEDFSKVTEGTLESVEFAKSQEYLDAYTHNPGWWGAGHALAKGYMVLSPYSGAATITTPETNLTANEGKFQVRIKMAEGAYGRYYTGNKITVSLYDDDPNAEDGPESPVESHEVTIDQNTFSTYTIDFTKGSAYSYVVVSYSGSYKLFIDEMALSQELQAGDKWSETLAEYETEDTHYDITIESPKAGAVYSYYVNAIAETVEDGNITDLYSDDSNVIEVTLGGTDGIGSIDSATAQVSAQDGVISVQLAQAGRIAVYDLSGRLIAQTAGQAGANQLSIAQGQVVIVKAAGRAFKLAL